MKRIAVFGATLGLVLSLFPAVALAQDTVPTQANVNGSSSPPQVLYKFEVPDANSGTPGIQYVSDDAADFVTGAQIAPNLEDLPEVQQIAYWWVATDPNGTADIVDAWVDVYHPLPNNTLKYQLHSNGQYACSNLGKWNTPGTPLSAAYRSGQISSADADAIITICGKGEYAVFMAVGELSKHQPAGDYLVQAFADDQAGNTGHLDNIMQVLPMVGLEIDFTSVNFGEILPNTPKWVRGDEIFGTANLPSVKNTGNVNMYLGLTFDAMVGQNNTYHKTINEFDGKLNSQPLNASAGVTVCFDQEPLGSNVVKQLDLSIHPGFIPADVYKGNLYLSGGQTC